MKTWASLVFLLVLASVSSATPSQDWLTSWVEDGNEYVKDVVNTYDGGSALLVQVDATQPDVGYDVMVIKYDADGNEEWASQVSVDDWDFPRAFDQTPSNEFYIVGYGYPENDHSAWHPILLTIDENGTPLWSDNGDNLAAVSLEDVTVYEPNYVTVCGEDDDSEAYVARLGDDGIPEWETITARTNTIDYFQSLRGYIDGGVILAGRSIDGFSDILAAKVDADGNFEWITEIDHQDEVPGGIEFDHEDNIYISGTIAGGPDTDVCVAKIDPDGNEIWFETYDFGSGYMDRGLSIAWYNDVMLIAGDFPDDDNLYGFFAINPDGTIAWQIGLDDVKYTTAIEADPDAGFFVGGYVGGANDMDDPFCASYDNGGGAGPDVTLTLIPGPSVLPPGGGPMQFDAILENNFMPYTTNARLRVVHLDSGAEWITRTWNSITLPMGYNSYFLTQNVPAIAPSGDYELFAEIYNTPSNILLADSFVFTKQAAATNGLGHQPGATWGVEGNLGQLAGAADSDVTSLARDYTLHRAYPNPFNPTTTVAVTLPESATLTLAVYDITGRQVSELHTGQVSAGAHQWTFDAHGLSSGVYFVHAQVPGQLNSMQKLTLLK